MNDPAIIHINLRRMRAGKMIDTVRLTFSSEAAIPAGLSNVIRNLQNRWKLMPGDSIHVVDKRHPGPRWKRRPRKMLKGDL